MRAVLPRLALWPLVVAMLVALLVGQLPLCVRGESARQALRLMAGDRAGIGEDAAAALDFADRLLADTSVESAAASLVGPDALLVEARSELEDAALAAEEEAADAALLEFASVSHSDSDSHSRSLSHSHSHSRTHSRTTRNGPITPVARSPRGSTLRFKATMPARLRFDRMVKAAEARIEKEEKEDTVAADKHGHDAEAEEADDDEKPAASARRRHRSSSSLVEHKAETRHTAHAASTVAPDGSEGDWTKAPIWWNAPDAASASPWKEDAYAYVLRHRDPNTNMNPDPFPTLMAGRRMPLGGVRSPMQSFAFHRLLRTPVVSGTPASVYAYQFPPAPPLPEIDANMQPANNYPNPPFYEHNYDKDFIWG